MPTYLAIAFFLFAALTVGVLVFVVVRLHREPPPENLSPRAQRLARWAGAPSIFDGLLARPMTKREIFGWIVFALVALGAVVFAG